MQKAADGERICAVCHHRRDHKPIAGCADDFKLARALFLAQKIVDKGNGRFGKLAVAHGFKPKAQQLLFQINFVEKDFNRVGVQLAGVFGQDKLFFAANFIGGGVNKRAVQLLFPFLLFQIATGVGFGDLFQNVF